MYIEEAHATDEWPISSSRFMPDNEPVSVTQPKTIAERVAVAQTFATTFDITGLKLLIDDPTNNAFEKDYAPWPIRLYVIENGVIQYISEPTECSHDVGQLRTWLNTRHNT